MMDSYIHNSSNSAEYETSLPPHRRTHSSTSGVTTLQGSSDYSHTDPLLQHDALKPSAEFNLSSRQPSHTNEPHPEWAACLSLDADSMNAGEHKAPRENIMRKQLKRLRWYKCSLGTVITAFAVYNTVRYFLAFTTYESIEGQTVSLALGISTGSVFAFTICSIVIWLFQPYLLVHRVPLVLLLRIRTAFHSAASFALLAPAIVNTALLFVWKNSPIKELNIRRRCHVDIDVIWSVSGKECKPPAWDVWILLSILRLVITIIILIFYHWIAVKYRRVHQLSLSRSPRNRHVPGSSCESCFSPRLPPMTGISPPLSVNPVRPPSHSQHHSSESTLYSHSHSKHPSSHSNAVNSVHSDEETVGNHHQPDSDTETTEAALDDYHEHSRQLVCQITRETEEALELTADQTEDIEPDTPSTMDFNLPRIPPAVGYDEFGRPYPPDEHVSILNSFVRRMPTIESMGSREMGSSIYSYSDAMTTSARSSLPLSRPPTRANTLDSTFGSRPSSGTNSITAGAEFLLNACRTTEVGELVDKSSFLNVRATTSSSSSSSSYPSTMMTYYTATSHGSNTSFGFPPSGTR